jgi:hypothetical protein
MCEEVDIWWNPADARGEPAGTSPAVRVGMSKRVAIFVSLLLLSLTASEAHAQPPPIFEYQVGATVGGDGTPTAVAQVRAMAFVPPIIVTDTRIGLLLAQNQIAASNLMSASTQSGLSARANRSGFCGPFSMVDSQVVADDDWEVFGDPASMRFTSSGRGDHRITGWGNCIQLFDHDNKHSTSEKIDAPFRVSSVFPTAKLDFEALLSATQSLGSGLPVVRATGSTMGAWELWNDANGNSVIDPADQMISQRPMSTGIGDTIGPLLHTVQVATSGRYVVRFFTSTSTSMTFRPTPIPAYNPSSIVDTVYSVRITVR